MASGQDITDMVIWVAQFFSYENSPVKDILINIILALISTAKVIEIEQQMKPNKKSLKEYTV